MPHNPKLLIPIAILSAAALITSCASGTSPAAKIATPTITVTATPTPSPTPVSSTPAPAPSTRVVTRTKTKTKAPPAPTIIVVSPTYQPPAPPYQPFEPQYRGTGYPDYSGSAFGTFHLTRFAYPGPIHSYVSPTDTSSWVRTIPATSWVTVYCMVRGQPLQGADMWDWDGSGWIWDQMVDMNGGNPAPC